MDDLAIAKSDADPLLLQIQASTVMLFGEMTKDSGSYQVRVDGGEPKSYSAKCAEGNMRLVQLIAEGLDPARTHEIEIIPTLKTGEELRVESVCVAGAPATVTSGKACGPPVKN